MMKKSLVLCAILALAACNNGIEQQAGQQLAAAQAAYERGDYETAKTHIDSIKILYPKAFETRKAGQALLLDVETELQQKTLAYLDSLQKEKNRELDALRPQFVFEKDTAYQQTGHYLWPTQTIEKNLHRSFLRFQTDERGNMTMTSIYCGNTHIHHIGIKVTAPDGTFAETPSSKDSYETTDLNEKIEKADYKLGEDGGLIDFVVLNKDRQLRVDYLGERPYKTIMNPTDRQAATEIYHLSQLLSSLQEIKKEQEAAQLKIDFIRKKKERKAAEEMSGY